MFLNNCHNWYNIFNCHNWYNISIIDIIEKYWYNWDNMWNNTLFHHSNWSKKSVDKIENNWNNSITNITDIKRLLFQLYHLCHYYFYSVVAPGHHYSQNRLCHQLYGLYQIISAKNGDTSYFWLCHAQFCWDNAYNSMHNWNKRVFPSENDKSYFRLYHYYTYYVTIISIMRIICILSI